MAGDVGSTGGVLTSALTEPFKRALVKLAVKRWNPTRRPTTLRRPHPYFSRLDRRGEATRIAPRQQVASEPLVKPKDQAGVLWEPFRDDREAP